MSSSPSMTPPAGPTPPTTTLPPSSGSFGTLGIVRTKITTDGVPTWESGKVMKLQADGKILVAGMADDGDSNNFGIIRYNTNGTLDTSFNSTGKVSTDISGSSFDDVMDLVVQSDGKILAAGSTQGNLGDTDFALVRYNTDGSLDTSFHSTGKVITDLGGFDDEITAMALQSDGKIVVAGYTDFSGGYDFALARYNSDGSLDTTFNSTGIVITDIGTAWDRIGGLVLQSDGKVVVAGTSYSAGNNDDFTLARYNTNGTLDTSFNSNGKVTTDLGNSGRDQIKAVALQADGKIVVTGSQAIGFDKDIALVRYNTNGTLDTSFNSTGKVITNLGTNYDESYAIQIQSDGKIVVAGFTEILGDRDFALVRYNTNGSLDTSFNSTGVLTTNLGAITDEAYSIVFQSDGKLLAAGYTEFNFLGNFGVVRYNTNWTLDTSFNSTGIVSTDFGTASNDEFRATVVQNDGKILAAGRTDASGSWDFAMIRYNVDGSLDTSFNSTGTVVTDLDSGTRDEANAITLQSDGKILVAGFMHYMVSDDFTVARYNTDGSLDTSFNSTGFVHTDINSNSDDVIYSIKVQSDGKIVAAGNSNGMLAVVRYNADGSLDTSFNSTGMVVTNLGTFNSTINAIALQSDGKILAAGKSDAAGSYDFLLVRYNSDGSLDTSFHSTGIFAIDIGTNTDDSAQAIALQSDGKILLTGRADRGGGFDLAVVRCNPNGTLDAAFNSTGIVTTQFGMGTSDYGTGIAVQNDGAIVVSGYSENAGGTTREFALARYNSSGSLDTSFGTGGKVTADLGSGASDYAFGIALLSDGKMIAVGSTDSDYPGRSDFALVRFNADGSR